MTKATPFDGVRPAKNPVPSREKIERYSDAEIERLLEHCESDAETVIVLLSAHAGLRIGKMCSLTWPDFKQGLISTTGKGRKKRTNATSDRLIQALESLKADPDTPKRSKRPPLAVLPRGC